VPKACYENHQIKNQGVKQLFSNQKKYILAQFDDASDNSEKYPSATTSRGITRIGQLEEKYFDYSPDCLDKLEKKTSTTSSSRSSTTSASAAVCHARGLSLSRTRVNYRQRSGARHQLAPEYEKSPSRPAISSTSATRRSQQRSRARQELRLRS
jgi:hypothetical protein